MDKKEKVSGVGNFKENRIKTFKCYTWPNKAFPFREYLKHDKCRIFIIENIHHNWNWLSEYHEYIKPTDYFFVYCGWYHSDHFAKVSDQIFSILGLEKRNFFILFNSPQEMENFKAYSFRGEVINHNCWLDEHGVMRYNKQIEKIYDAVYTARMDTLKRHYLANKVKNLALIAGNTFGVPVEEIPPHVYKNPKPIPPHEVCRKLNESRCGLMLSAEEGACFSSSEYLLCGIPVVSTKCLGGRDVWYNEDNSVICEDNADSVAECVEKIKTRTWDPIKIRETHIEQSLEYRRRFIEQLKYVFSRFGVTDIDAEKYFYDTYYHKLRSSYKPNFDQIFKGTDK